ncbi:hypothetical protein GCK32_014843 [Trichostrongylus colubriformis]|uniref:Uncharacterized protein n=1 Tax=Trichostrongylus colubriformis TaxID=6319 RepID=A0AAN8F5S2_TRICO
MVIKVVTESVGGTGNDSPVNGHSWVDNISYCSMNCLGDDSNGASGVFDSLALLYPSSNGLARDLLSSDDRFLATASALFHLKSRLGDIPLISPFHVVLAAFRDIQFEAKVLMDWIDGDELGLETVSAIVKSLSKDRGMWKKAADPSCSVSPPLKRQRLTLCEEAAYRTTYLWEKPAPAEDDIIVKVRVPHMEGTGTYHEESFTFSRKPLISTVYRSLLPQPDPTDFTALEEMMVELKLMLNKKLLESGGLNEGIERLREALTMFLDEEDDDDDEEEEEEDEG